MRQMAYCPRNTALILYARDSGFVAKAAAQAHPGPRLPPLRWVAGDLGPPAAVAHPMSSSPRGAFHLTGAGFYRVDVPVRAALVEGSTGRRP
jgi:hypothetical protein